MNAGILLQMGCRISLAFTIATEGKPKSRTARSSVIHLYL